MTDVLLGIAIFVAGEMAGALVMSLMVVSKRRDIDNPEERQ